MSLQQRVSQGLPKMQGRGLFQPSTYNEADNTIEVVFATETPVKRSKWGESFIEILDCSKRSVQLQRLNQGGPVVDSHNTWSMDSQFAVVERAWVDESTRECRALIRFSKTEGDKEKVEKIKDGIIRNVSVGYIIHEAEVTDGEENKLPELRATDWEPHEISFLPMQADMNSGTRAAEENVNEIKITNVKASKMSETKAALTAERKRSAEIFKACRAADLSDEYAQELLDGEMSIEECRAAILAKKSDTLPANTKEVGEKAVKEERTRISEIHKAVRTLGLPVEFGEKLVEDGVSLDNARAAIIDEKAKSNTAAPSLHTGFKPGEDEADKKARGMVANLLIRSGFEDTERVKAGDPGEFRGMSLIDTAKECLILAGHSVRGMSHMEIASEALKMHSRGAGGQSSADFPNILANVMNKSLRADYQLQEKSFVPWTRKTPATDFREMLRSQLNDFKLSQVKEGGEYSYATVGDSGEKYKVGKFGKIINIDWEAVMNDDLNAFSRLPQKAAAAVAQMQADGIYGILTASHLMSDSAELFVAGHGNLTSSGTAISVASLGVGRELMRKQTAPGGSNLNIAPKYLIVGPENEALALQYTSANYVSAKSSDINVWAGMLTAIVDARITGKQWFLAADPRSIDTIEYATIDGEELYTESKYSFEKDAFQYKIRSVFGAKAIDWRGLYKNAGA
ncbi:Mu-like prophage major head subunit gpT family protein [Parasegetibacter sp. NRK P23]|uniref:Mu-like prophage major head subunit gpT family protein n=1 Tax=Parasegetibacter sp. NRK P23 TaxID=2942999 RepID=UPI002042FEB8|nr:Mu-like prophage major head subunit gpT family protein [Parasegetibacter sp. NRK P23]MCM5528960.1 Mu-like prophage major head subunit gpT family protein [Parasegetibacter sp. NRK P23]